MRPIRPVPLSILHRARRPPTPHHAHTIVTFLICWCSFAASPPAKRNAVSGEAQCGEHAGGVTTPPLGAAAGSPGEMWWQCYCQ